MTNFSAELPGRANGEQSAGFSLIDMLVALVLLSIISGLMVAFIGQFRVLQRVKTDIATKMEMEALASYLEGTIGSAMPLPFLDNQADTRFVFEGAKSRLRFTTIARQGLASFGLRETNLALKGNSDLQILVQDFYPRRVDEQARTAATTTIELASDIKAVEFEYLTYEPETRTPIWSNEWLGKNGLPAAVRFVLTTVRDGKPRPVSGYAVVSLATDIYPETAPGT